MVELNTSILKIREIYFSSKDIPSDTQLISWNSSIRWKDGILWNFAVVDKEVRMAGILQELRNVENLTKADAQIVAICPFFFSLNINDNKSNIQQFCASQKLTAMKFYMKLFYKWLYSLDYENKVLWQSVKLLKSWKLYVFVKIKCAESIDH